MGCYRFFLSVQVPSFLLTCSQEALGLLKLMKAQIQRMTKAPVNAAAADAQRCVTCNAPRIVLSDLRRNVHLFGKVKYSTIVSTKTDVYVCDSFVYDYLTENDHTCSPGVSLGEIGSEIHRIGFPRQKGLLSQVLSRRRDLFEVYDNSRNGLFVFALPPRRQETGQPETRRPQPPNAPPSFVEPPSGYFFAADLQIMLAPSCIFFRPLSGGSAVTVASAPSSSSAEGISSPMRGAISELSSLFPTTDLVRILDFYVIF